MGLKSSQEWMIEHLIFFDLCKRYHRRDVEQVYIAIQSALTFNIPKIDVGMILGKIRPPGYLGLDDGYDPAIGSTGLAFFYWLYKIELIDEGMTNYHSYKFTRHHDELTLEVYMKTSGDPNGEWATENYQEQLRKLEKSRMDLFVKKRYGTIME